MAIPNKLDVLRGRLLGSPIDHEGRQACSVLISVVTQMGALVAGIAYGCPYYKGPAIFHLLGKVPQAKNRLFPANLLPLCKPLRLIQIGQMICPGGENLLFVSRNFVIKKNTTGGENLWLDMMRAAAES